MYNKQKIREIVKRTIYNVLFEEENNEIIEPTVEFVKRKYNEFNAAYFDGFLPRCSISVTPIGERGGHVIGGRFQFRNTSGLLNLGNGSFLYADKYGGYHHPDKTNVSKLLKPLIIINAKYKAPIKQLENTIIHEMCHFYTFFNEDGTFRLADSENNLHGEDFLRAAEMVNRKSNGEFKIKSVLEAEEIESMSASSYFEKGGYKICTADYRGRQILWFTKYPSIWIKFAIPMLGVNEINVTDDPQLLMLLKRYRYTPLTYRNKSLKVFPIDDAPAPVSNAINKAKYITVTTDNYNEIFGDDD